MQLTERIRGPGAGGMAGKEKYKQAHYGRAEQGRGQIFKRGQTFI